MGLMFILSGPALQFLGLFGDAAAKSRVSMFKHCAVALFWLASEIEHLVFNQAFAKACA